MSRLTPTAPCILVYNPISGHGHLDSWNAMFISILLNAGWRVNALTPDSRDLIKRLKTKGQDQSQWLNVIDWSDLRPSIFQRILNRAQIILKIKNVKRTELSDLDPRYLDPLEIARRVNDSLSRCKWRPEIVFNMYMDMYPVEGSRWHQFEQLNKLPWAGIRFVPTSEMTEAYYNQSLFKGMCFLDQQVCKKAQLIKPEKVFGYLPDITENALPETKSDLVQSIKIKAAGRKIVFMGGTIGGNKNLSRWYQLIAKADPAKFYFVQIGEMFENTLTNEDAIELVKIRAHCPENLFIKLEYLTDETLFNEVIQASDIIFAVYRNFKISSNMPGKAAAFSKPIMVAEGYLMGERVKRYGIGATVAEDDIEAMLSALAKLANQTQALEAQFEAYRRDFSVDALSLKLNDFLKRCMAQK